MNALIIRSEVPKDSNAIEAVTVAALRNAGALTVSLVAEIDDALVGHVAVSPVSISDGADNWFGLGPISVHPDRQAQGIGSRLMREALRQLAEQGASGCVVLGEPSYYQRFGFKNVPDLVLPEVPPEYFMALAFGSTMPRGTVSYHQAFSINP